MLGAKNMRAKVLGAMVLRAKGHEGKVPGAKGAGAMGLRAKGADPKNSVQANINSVHSKL